MKVWSSMSHFSCYSVGYSFFEAFYFGLNRAVSLKESFASLVSAFLGLGKANKKFYAMLAFSFFSYCFCCSTVSDIFIGFQSLSPSSSSFLCLLGILKGTFLMIFLG